MNRRSVVIGAASLTGLASIATWWALRGNADQRLVGQVERGPPPSASGMRYRKFGATDLNVSEVGFGSWGIGGQAYGAVEEAESLRALALAEELGCNFVDTAQVYGDSERVLGKFLQGRRSRWIVATKYSGQREGMTATLERQLVSMRTDTIDFYQLHWVPRGREESLFDELSRLKQSGKVRFIGVSLYSARDIDNILKRPQIDGFQVAFNLLEPDPFMARLSAIRAHGKAVVIRSALREGFLTGKYRRDATFPDPHDQRSRWSREQIEKTVDLVEQFRFLEADAGSMVVAAARYPLSFPEVSTVVMGTKTAAQAQSNFGAVPAGRLSADTLKRIEDLQTSLGLGDRWPRLLRSFGIAK